MARRAGGNAVPLLEAGDAAGLPRYLRLYRRIRTGILEGTVPPGTRLPSSRTLAREQGISRNTVEAALGQLQAEGFVVRRVGAGSWVSERLPLRAPPARPGRGAEGSRRVVAEPPAPAGKLSARGRRFSGLAEDLSADHGLAFAPCMPALESVPLQGWARIVSRLARRLPSAAMLAPPPAGLLALREAVASYLGLGRGVRCTPEQVVIVHSAQQALDLVGRLLLDAGDAVWFEEPGYLAARHALAAAGARLVAVPVDGDGVDVAAGAVRAPAARLAYVTPSHQYPMGVTLSLARRVALLDWAERTGGWILEDDYDSELRYDGRPHAAMQGIDEGGRVIYVGTFNKILFPGLRLAYLVVPPGLVPAFAGARLLTDGFVAPLIQRAMAEYIQDGHFAVHLRRVRSVYRERRDRCLDLVERELPVAWRAGPAAAGMHVALHGPAGIDDRAVARRARRQGLAVPALSAHFLEAEAATPGLLVHYGNVSVAAMPDAVRRLARALGTSRVARRTG